MQPNLESPLLCEPPKVDEKSTLLDDVDMESPSLHADQEKTPAKSTTKPKRGVKRKNKTAWSGKRKRKNTFTAISKKIKQINQLQDNLDKQRKEWSEHRKQECDAELAAAVKTMTYNLKYDFRKLSVKIETLDVAKEIEKLKKEPKTEDNKETKDEVDSKKETERKDQTEHSNSNKPKTKENSEQNEPNSGANKTEEKSEDNEPRQAKPSNLTEPDPLLKSLDKDKVDSILEDDKPKRHVSSKYSEKHFKTSDGGIQIEGYGIPVREKKVRDFSCPKDGCDKVAHKVKELNEHIRNVHSDYKFKCEHCPKMYTTIQQCAQMQQPTLSKRRT